MTTTALRYTKDQLLDALEARRPWAEDGDRVAKRKHEADEKTWHKAFVARCRELAKMSYAEVKDLDNGYRSRGYFQGVPDRPSCPTSRVAKLDKAINLVNAARQATYQVSPSGMWSDVFWLLTFDDTINPDICS